MKSKPSQQPQYNYVQEVKQMDDLDQYLAQQKSHQEQPHVRMPAPINSFMPEDTSANLEAYLAANKDPSHPPQASKMQSYGSPYQRQSTVDGLNDYLNNQKNSHYGEPRKDSFTMDTNRQLDEYLKSQKQG